MPRLPIKDDTREVVNDDTGTSDADAAKAADADGAAAAAADDDGAAAAADDSTDDDLDDLKKDKIEDQAGESAERIQGILDEFGYDSLEDLEEDLPNFKDLRKKLGDKDADQLIKDSEYLAKVKEFWKEQDEAKKRDGETHDETIERLELAKKEAEDKLKDRDEKDAKARADQRKSKEAERMLNSFNVTVLDEIDKSKDFPKEYKSFAKEYLGVDNPVNEINIGLKTEVRKVTKDGLKKIKDFEQAVIKRYLGGKIKVPAIKPTDKTPVNTEKRPQNLAEARTQLFESFGVKR